VKLFSTRCSESRRAAAIDMLVTLFALASGL
jgi:hypothetical protein